MNESNLRELAIKIIGIIDYDMGKEAVNEPDEWEDVLRGIENVLIDIYNDGYAYCETDYYLDDR